MADQKIPITITVEGNYYGALGGTVRYMVIVYKNTYYGCTENWICTVHNHDNMGANAQLVGVYDQSLNTVQ